MGQWKESFFQLSGKAINPAAYVATMSWSALVCWHPFLFFYNKNAAADQKCSSTSGAFIVLVGDSYPGLTSFRLWPFHY